MFGDFKNDSVLSGKRFHGKKFIRLGNTLGPAKTLFHSWFG